MEIIMVWVLVWVSFGDIKASSAMAVFTSEDECGVVVNLMVDKFPLDIYECQKVRFVEGEE